MNSLGNWASMKKADSCSLREDRKRLRRKKGDQDVDGDGDEDGEGKLRAESYK